MPYPNITTNFDAAVDLKNRYNASYITALQTAVNSIIAAMPHKQQVVVVAKARGDYTALSSAAAAITDASASKPYAILLMPGIYETSEATLPDYVSVVGVDKKSCVLKSTTANTDYVIAPGSHSFISNVGIINACAISSEKDPKCIYINGKTVDINNCILENTASYISGTTNVATCVEIDGASTVEIRDTAIIMNAGNGFDIYVGIGAQHASIALELWNCAISVLSGGILAYGMDINAVNTLEVRNTRIESVANCYFSIVAATSSLFEDCLLETTANNYPPVTVSNDNTYWYNCTLRAHGGASNCIDTGGSFNIRVAHCRMNRASPIHANLTNLIGTPYNVMDTDV